MPRKRVDKLSERPEGPSPPSSAAVQPPTQLTERQLRLRAAILQGIANRIVKQLREEDEARRGAA